MSKAAELAALIGSQTALSNRNMIINGAMTVAQRGTSSTGVGASNDVFPCVDRMKIFAGNTAGRATVSQVADVHDGFANALKFECTTADTSIAADEFFGMQYRIEGQDLQQLKKGTSDAESVTLSFYVKGNAAAEYTLELRDLDNDRINTQTFNVTTSWTRVEVTFAADTTGAYDDDNASSLQISWWLHAGSTYTSGTFASNSWASRTQANRVKSSNSSFFDSTARTFFITGVQLEVGETATPFEHEDFGTTLAKCQRYYQKSTEVGTAVNTATTVGAIIFRCVGTGWTSFSYLHTAMRDTPTATVYSTRTGASGKVGNLSAATDVTGSSGPSENSIYITATMSNAHLGAANWELEAEL